MSERERLIEQYRLKHEQDPAYGPSTHHHRLTLDLLQKHKCRTLLDFGCGKGRLVDAVNKEGFQAIGYDPAVPGKEQLPEIIFDMVTCLDVAEHWNPDDVENELVRVFTRCGKLVFFVVCCRPAVHKLPNGENCHTTVKTEDWWRSKIRGVFLDWDVVRSIFHEGSKSLIYILKR